MASTGRRVHHRGPALWLPTQLLDLGAPHAFNSLRSRTASLLTMPRSQRMPSYNARMPNTLTLRAQYQHCPTPSTLACTRSGPRRNTQHHRSIHHHHHRLHVSTYHALPTMDADVYVPAVWSLGRCFTCWRWDIMSLPIDHWPAEIVLPIVGMDVEGQPSTEAKRTQTVLHATPLMLSVARPISFVILLVMLRIRQCWRSGPLVSTSTYLNIDTMHNITHNVYRFTFIIA